MLSRNDIGVLAVVGAWVLVWLVIGWLVTLVGRPNTIESDAVVFSGWMGLFVGTVFGAFGSTESREFRARKKITIAATLIAAAMPMYLPSQTDRAQWAFNMAAIGAGSIISFPLLRIATTLVKRMRTSTKKRGGPRD